MSSNRCYFIKLLLLFFNYKYLFPQGARDSLHGRFFGGRHVNAHVYDQIMYEEQDFSH